MKSSRCIQRKPEVLRVCIFLKCLKCIAYQNTERAINKESFNNIVNTQIIDMRNEIITTDSTNVKKVTRKTH